MSRLSRAIVCGRAWRESQKYSYRVTDNVPPVCPATASIFKSKPLEQRLPKWSVSTGERGRREKKNAGAQDGIRGGRRDFNTQRINSPVKPVSNSKLKVKHSV